MNWVWLAFAIAAEVIATSALKASDGLIRMPYVLAAICCVALSFGLLGLALRTVPMGVAYAIWAGAGIASITAIGAFGFGQWPGPWTYLGIGFVLAGVVVLYTLADTQN
ncbi:DMT family transporter [Litoreibacter roseus]|uniref:Multidrug SMR transporter n=1 Tax=Litoreibacter roseus TaxID=2601869 RepID=A0A6N6JC09_9RHOB|nr:multidrug efflux SMR transporter [Litoreibacter roseus]GFE63841.1 multidrug SMR transporter [Litoreibacter roseus]